MAEKLYLNGRLVPASQARLSPFDHGFLYGFGLFETMRAYGGCIFRLDRHTARLRNAARTLGLADRLGGVSLEKACEDTLAANGLGDARLRLSVSAGEGDMLPDPESCPRPTVLVAARALTPLPSERYEEGFSAVLSSLRRDSHSPLSQLKTACYLGSVLARSEARKAGADEAILLNEHGRLAEASSSNLFVVRGGQLLTPSVGSGVLPGITREAVLELARRLGIYSAERELGFTELAEAEEAFLTNSIIEVMPLTSFAGKPVGSGRPGETTRKLMAAYRDLVERSLR